jgi:hypothetical protein
MLEVKLAKMVAHSFQIGFRGIGQRAFQELADAVAHITRECLQIQRIFAKLVQRVIHGIGKITAGIHECAIKIENKEICVIF